MSTGSTQSTDRPLLPVLGADTTVPLVTGDDVRYADLDQAASTPALQHVADVVQQLLPRYASVHRGAGYLSQACTALYEQARATVAAFVGAREDDVTVLTRNTTDALNLLARSLPAGSRVVSLDVEHHADLLPWRQHAEHQVVAAAPTVAETLDRLSEALRHKRTALLAVTGASNVTGETLPLTELVRIAHDAGARVVLDAAQLAPHRAVDVAATGVDYLALSGHKLYAPFGAGALVGRRDWLDDAEPYLPGGGAARDVATDEVRWAAAPHRHEGGTPNLVGAVALAAACEVLAALPDGALEQHETALRDRLLTGLSALPAVTVHRFFRDSAAPVGVVALSVGDTDPGLLAAYLSAEHGIGVRDGRFCAHPALERLGRPDGALRVSVGLGTTTADVDRLVAALTRFLAVGPQAEYQLTGTGWQPLHDPRPAPSETGLLGLLSTGPTATTTTAPCTRAA